MPKFYVLSLTRTISQQTQQQPIPAGQTRQGDKERQKPANDNFGIRNLGDFAPCQRKKSWNSPSLVRFVFLCSDRSKPKAKSRDGSWPSWESKGPKKPTLVDIQRLLLVLRRNAPRPALTAGEAAHDTGPAEEPQEADEADEGEAGGGKQQELEEPSGTRSGGLLRVKVSIW